MIDTSTIRELAQIMRENKLSKLDISDSGSRIILENQAAGTSSCTPQLPVSTVSEMDGTPNAPEHSPISEVGTAVKAPLVGTVYLSPKPGEAPYVTVGSSVNAGDVLCTVEAMKMFNEITAPHDGTVKSVEVKNGQAVGYGEKLFVIERV